MKEQEAYEAALDAAPRHEDGSVDIKALEDELVELIEFDAEQEKRNKARRIIERKKRPGGTEPDGKIALPGLEKYDYEPNRLVQDNEGRVIEQYRCQPRHKQAEAERARINAGRAMKHADRKTNEAETYASWAINELTSGRLAATLNYQAFVMENGYWLPPLPGEDISPEPDDAPDGDELD